MEQKMAERMITSGMLPSKYTNVTPSLRAEGEAIQLGVSAGLLRPSQSLLPRNDVIVASSWRTEGEAIQKEEKQ